MKRQVSIGHYLLLREHEAQRGHKVYREFREKMVKVEVLKLTL